MRVLGEGAQVGHAVERAARREGVLEGEGAERRVPARGTAVDGEPRRVGKPLLDKVFGAGADVVDVDDAPAAAQPAPVVAAVAGGATCLGQRLGLGVWLGLVLRLRARAGVGSG